MTSQLREYARPRQLNAAAELLRRGDVRSAPLWLGPRAPDEPFAVVDVVVDLDELDLAFIQEMSDGLVRLGAATRLQDLADSPLLRSLAGGILAHAAHLSAGSAMRHAASLGGALLYAGPAASKSEREGPPEILLALLALEAQVVQHSHGRQETASDLAEYLTGAADERSKALLVEVRFARSGVEVAGAIERVARTPADQALVAAAAVLQAHGPVLEWARVAVAAGGHGPLRLAEVERKLAGQALTPALLDEVAGAAEAAVRPQDDFRATAEYRRAVTGIVVRRALLAAHKQSVAHH